MKDESTVSQEIQIAAVNSNCILMRNNSGAALDNTGRLVRYGLGNISKQHSDRIKSSDLIGLTKMLITQEMVGKYVGVFTAIEVKREDWEENRNFNKRETAQLNFINWVKSHGGFAGFANSVNRMKEIFDIHV